ncbi:BGTF surface domain-containing protein [Halovenus rubra]|uniref:BGTF surface domain-containing protein n=2 Tax=Halovenus rubra TaxID=869890 RepID=A0ACC7DW26_9EURY|nr:BGTF surface domain-containing protein [Halovenus rubra]
MTDSTEKLRAVFLAAIMVVSVFAMTVTFSGAAVAQASTNASVDFQDQDSLGDSVLVDEVNVDNYNTGTVKNVTVFNLSDGDRDMELGDASVSGTTTNIPVTLTTEITESQDLEAVAFNNSGDAIASSTASISYVEDYQQIQGDADAPRIWVGQNIVIDGNYNLGNDYDVYSTSTSSGDYYAGSFVREVRATANGQLIVRSTTIEPGVHVTENATKSISSGEGPINTENFPSFELTEQFLEVDGVEDTSVDSTQFTIGEIDSNRAGYDLEVQLEDGTVVDTLNNLGDYEEDVVVDHGLGVGDYNFSFEVTDTPASDESGHEVTPELDQELEIVSPEPQTDQFVRGDIVPIELDIQAADTGTITIGDRQEGQSIELNVTFEDSDGDGSALFYLNTYQIGDDNSSYGATDAGNGVYGTSDTTITNVDKNRVEIGGGSAGQDVIAAGSYDLVAAIGENSWKNSSTLVQDRSSLRLNERGTQGVNVYTAPGTGDAQIQPETTDDVEAAIENGVVTAADGTIADNDYFLLQIESSGLEGLLHTAALDNSNVADFGILDRSDDHIISDAWFAADALTGIGQQADAGPNLDEFFLDMQEEVETDPNSDVIAGTDDTGNLDSYWLPIKVQSGEEQVKNPGRSLEAGEEMVGIFSVEPPIDTEYFGDNNNTNPAFADVSINKIGGDAGNDAVYEKSYNEQSVTPWTFVSDQASVVVEGTTLGAMDELAVPQEDNITVSGQTNIAAGTPLNVNFVAASGEEEAFFVSTEATVEYVEGAPNTWETTIDFGDRPVGTEFEVNIRRGGSAPLLNPQGESTLGVVTAEPAVNEFTFADQDSGGSSVVVDTFNTTQGGYVEILNSDGDRVGLSNLQDTGEQNRIAISLDQDLEENQELTARALRTMDQAYMNEDGNPVETSAAVTVEQPDPAEFTVSDLSPENAATEQGSTVEVSATIANDGGEEAETSVELLLDGSTAATKSATLAGGESTTVTFEVDTSDLEPGTYVHGIATGDDDASGALTVEAASTPTPTPTETATPEPTETQTPEQTETATATEESSDGDGAGFGVVVALLAFLGASLLAVRRQTRE